MAEAQRALAYDRQHQHGHGLRANRAFVVESLLLLLFLAFALALILRVFAAADGIGRDAHAKNVALRLANNAAEVFAANPLADHNASYFDLDGNEVKQDDATAAFKVSLDVNEQASTGGTLYNATVKVAPLTRRAGSGDYQVETARYVSNARLAALAAYAAQQANQGTAAQNSSSEQGAVQDVPKLAPAVSGEGGAS